MKYLIKEIRDHVLTALIETLLRLVLIWRGVLHKKVRYKPRKIDNETTSPLSISSTLFFSLLTSCSPGQQPWGTFLSVSVPTGGILQEAYSTLIAHIRGKRKGRSLAEGHEWTLVHVRKKGKDIFLYISLVTIKLTSFMASAQCMLG